MIKCDISKTQEDLPTVDMLHPPSEQCACWWCWYWVDLLCPSSSLLWHLSLIPNKRLFTELSPLIFRSSLGFFNFQSFFYLSKACWNNMMKLANVHFMQTTLKEGTCLGKSVHVLLCCVLSVFWLYHYEHETFLYRMKWLILAMTQYLLQILIICKNGMNIADPFFHLYSSLLHYFLLYWVVTSKFRIYNLCCV